MHSFALALMILFSLFAVPQSLAAPTSSDVSLSPRLGPWIIYPSYVPCDISDTDCDCSRNVDGSLEYYCGYVDGDWIHAGNKRELSRAAPFISGASQDLDHGTWKRDDSKSDVTAPYDGPADDFLVVKRVPGEIVERVQQPLITALALIGINTIRHGVRKVILNRLPQKTRNRFVQGLAGTLTSATTINGVRYAAGARWEIRWDFSWYGPGMKMPASGILGAHVNMLVQDNINTQKWALYLPADSFMYKMNMGDIYFRNVVKVYTTNLAQFTGQTSDWLNGGEFNAAKKIMQSWVTAWDTYMHQDLKH